MPVSYGSICCTYHQLKYSSPNRSTKPRATQKSLPFENGVLGKKNSGEWPKAEKDKTERATELGRRTRGDIYRVPTDFL